MRTRFPTLLATLALGLVPLACFEDPIQDQSSTGDGDGDPGTSSGDGDGDPATTTGDGDGDATTTGDGDGDATTTDGCEGELDECGVCNGPGGPCLGCTVPEASNFDELAEIDNGTCVCTPVGNPIADQSQLDSTSTAGGMSIWQSFTVGIGGGLARVDIELYSPLEVDDSEGTLTIYEGEGIGGTELGQVEVIVEAGNVGPVFQEFSLPDAVPLAAGRVYTFGLEVPVQLAGWVRQNTSNAYADGISSEGEDTDLIFRTHMVGCAPE